VHRTTTMNAVDSASQLINTAVKVVEEDNTMIAIATVDPVVTTTIIRANHRDRCVDQLVVATINSIEIEATMMIRVQEVGMRM